MTSADPMLARLKPLPARLRIAHLAALVRWERAKNARSLCYLSAHECEKGSAVPDGSNNGGRAG